MAISSDSRHRLLGTGSSAPLTRPPVVLTRTAWSPRVVLTVADWISQGRWLGLLGRGCGWWIGDWIRYGNARYGEKYAPAARATGYDVKSLMNMAYVAGRFEVSRRRAGLSFSHHAELASLPCEEQDLRLDRAEAGNLSVRGLRSERRRAQRRVESRMGRAEARRASDDEAGEVGGAVTMENLTTVVCPACGHQFAPTKHSPEVYSRGSTADRRLDRERSNSRRSARRRVAR
jgi:hypothetical protein